ncbi:hypothetical protein V8F06_010896 [Rhypophila decipiens]
MPVLKRGVLYVRHKKIAGKYVRDHSKATPMRWHLRLGHPGTRALEHLGHTTTGVKIVKKGITTVECDCCGVCKAKAQPSKQLRSKNEGAGQRIAMDIFDYKPGHGNFRYLLIFVDRRSGLFWDFYLVNREKEDIAKMVSYPAKWIVAATSRITATAAITTKHRQWRSPIAAAATRLVPVSLVTKRPPYKKLRESGGSLRSCGWPPSECRSPSGDRLRGPPLLSRIDRFPADGAGIVLLQPECHAVSMKPVCAWQNGDIIASMHLVNTNSALSLALGPNHSLSLPAVPPVPKTAAFIQLEHTSHPAVADLVRSFVHINFTTPVMVDGVPYH